MHACTLESSRFPSQRSTKLRNGNSNLTSPRRIFLQCSASQSAATSMHAYYVKSFHTRDDTLHFSRNIKSRRIGKRSERDTKKEFTQGAKIIRLCLSLRLFLCVSIAILCQMSCITLRSADRHARALCIKWKFHCTLNRIRTRNIYMHFQKFLFSKDYREI